MKSKKRNIVKKFSNRCEIYVDGVRIILDKEDLPRVAEHYWRANPFGKAKTSYARTYIYGQNRTTMPLMHRVIMDAPAGMFLDHINRNPTDNRKSNLRFATHSENARNQLRGENHGISFNKKLRKWHALIKPPGAPRIDLGFYANIDEARAIRRAAEAKYFGEFAPRRPK